MYRLGPKIRTKTYSPTRRISRFILLEESTMAKSVATKTKTDSSQNGAAPAKVDRQGLIDLLNEDLAREYQAIIAYVVYSQVLKGAKYMTIAKELETHAKEELAHAL